MDSSFIGSFLNNMTVKLLLTSIKLLRALEKVVLRGESSTAGNKKKTQIFYLGALSLRMKVWALLNGCSSYQQ